MFGSRPYSLKSLSEVEKKALDAALSIVSTMDDRDVSSKAKTALRHMQGFSASFDKEDISIATSSLIAIVSAAQSGKLSTEISSDVQAVFLAVAKKLTDMI